MENNTRARIRVAEVSPKYVVTTEEAKDFLQQRLSNRVQGVTVSLITIPFGDKFKPMLAILSPSALKGANKDNRNLPSIFSRNDAEDGRVNLKEEVFGVIGGFIFSKDDEKGFQAPYFKRDYGVTSKDVSMLKTYRTPKLHPIKVNGQNVNYVAVLIDPIRLFHHMVQNPDRRDERFQISVTVSKAMSDSNVEYVVEKVAANKDKRTGNIEQIVSKQIQSRFKG